MDISEIFRGGEVGDGFHVLFAWFHGVVANLEASKFDVLFGQVEFVWIEGDAVASTCV